MFSPINTIIILLFLSGLFACGQVSEPLNSEKIIEIKTEKDLATKILRSSVTQLPNSLIKIMILYQNKLTLEEAQGNETDIVTLCTKHPACIGQMYITLHNTTEQGEVFYRINAINDLKKTCAWVEAYPQPFANEIARDVKNAIMQHANQWAKECFKDEKIIILQ